MGYPTPKHFRDTHSDFAAYILICAIRDRAGFLERITTGTEPEPMRDQIAETREELRCMWSRLRLRRRAS